MAFPAPEAVLPIISIVFMVLAAFVFYRQKTSYFEAVRRHFVVCFVCVMVLSFFELPFLFVHSAEAVKLELSIVVSGLALMALIFGNAATILKYYPKAESSKDSVSLQLKKPHLSTVIYNSMMVAMGILAWIVPATPVQLKFAFSGGASYGVRYENWVFFFLTLALIVFVLYPVSTFWFSSKKTKDKKARNSMRILAVSSLFYAVFQLLFRTSRFSGLDLSEFSTISVVLPIASIIYAFKEPTVLSRFLESVAVTPKPGVTMPIGIQNKFSQSLGLERHSQLRGTKILYEFDAATDYEVSVADFVHESLANNELALVFTRIKSSINSTLAEEKAVRFFYLTPKVSVPEPGASENEVLLPAKNTALMLQTFDEVLKTDPQAKINIVFDSLSDLLLSIGFEKTYDFLRQVIEMLTIPRVTALILFNPEAHDPKTTSSLQTVFNSIIAYGKEGLKLIKFSEG